MHVDIGSRVKGEGGRSRSAADGVDSERYLKAATLTRCETRFDRHGGHSCNDTLDDGGGEPVIWIAYSSDSVGLRSHKQRRGDVGGVTCLKARRPV